MTYISIAMRIDELVQSGELVAYRPRLTTAELRRKMFISKELRATLDNPNQAVKFFRVDAEIEAALTLWALGEHIFANEDGGPDFLKRLAKPPPEIWEIRVTAPRPQVRIFGRFAEPDTFVALGIHFRPSLGDKSSRAWRAASNECKLIWEAMFPHHSPFSGSTSTDYVTENCDEFTI